MLDSSAVLAHAPEALLDETPESPVRVLSFVEARGVTGALGNLLDFASVAARQPRPIRFELAMYWRSRAPGEPGPCTATIKQAIDAAAAHGLHTHVLHERYAGDPRLLAQIRALLRRAEVDLVETHHVKSHALLAACGAGLPQQPWIAFHHGYTATSLKTRVLNLLDRWSLVRPTAIVTPCRAFAEDLSRRGIPRDRITVVHSSVSTHPQWTFSDVRSTLGLRDTDRLILAVGRLSKEKAHAVLIEALARAPLAGMRDAHLVVAGDGPERRRLADTASRLGLPRVHFVGRQDNVWPYYAAADVVALPSDSEGSPVALLEAMASRKPIVATRVGGVPEMLDHGVTGLLVPPRDPDALAAALANLLQCPTLAAALAARARAVVEERFTVSARARTLSAVYHRLCRA